VPHVLLRRDARMAIENGSIDQMLKARILERKSLPYGKYYDVKRGVCASYRIPERILQQIAEAEADALGRKTRYNLFTGKRLYRSRTTSLHDENGNRYPDVIADAMDRI